MYSGSEDDCRGPHASYSRVRRDEVNLDVRVGFSEDAHSAVSFTLISLAPRFDLYDPLDPPLSLDRLRLRFQSGSFVS